MHRIVTAQLGAAPSFDVVTRSEHTFVVTPGARSADDPGPAPMELLLTSLATCAGATIDSILSKMRIGVDELEVAVDAERAESPPRVWTDVALRYHIRAAGPVARLERAVEVTARTCSVSVMLQKAAALTEALYVVTEIDERETVDLRHRFLRAGMPRSSVPLQGESEATWFGVVHDDQVEGTAGVFEETSPDGDSRHRLRGMTTSESIRGSGLGRMLVHAACDNVRAQGGSSLWASARTAAAGFYTKLGFEIASNEYDVEGIGPHIRMRRAL